MRPPGFRFTVRQMAATVAVAGAALAGVLMVRRSARFRAIAAREAAAELMSRARPDADGGGLPPRGADLAAYHRGMRLKYERAARYPWLPVAPDPPMPE